MRHTLWLSPHAHAVAVETDLVFLDERADAYFCLPDLGGCLGLDDRSLSSLPIGFADDLQAAGIVQPTPPATVLPTRRVPTPARSLVRRAYGGLEPRDLPEILRGVTDILRAYRGKPLGAILAEARRDRRCDAPKMTPAVRQVSEAVQRWAPYAPVSGKCLLRAFLLLRRLRAAGEDAVWVFGVRTWPFSAHCWLQCEDVVLDDHLDRVRGFVPILTV